MIGSIERVSEVIYRIPESYRAGMRVPGIIFASEELLKKAVDDKAVEQVVNVAFLPGVVKASMAMPDIHWGYGFPIGGVAATRVEDGVVSPGGVGYDISCGVRLLRTDLVAGEHKELMAPLMHELSRSIPKGLGRSGKIKLGPRELDTVLGKGCRWAVDMGYGWAEDLEAIESNGTYADADPELVSDHAKQRGKDQLGTIGSGNHFVEVQEVAEIFDNDRAEAFGIFTGQLVIMIHSGSRGLGHQVCTDYLRVVAGAVRKLGIELPDRQLACAPVQSEEGKKYLAAMAAAANFGLTNRQCIAHWVRESFEHIFTRSSSKMGMRLVYDVSHNLARIEDHEVNGEKLTLCVHRKGATRAFGPGEADLSPGYQATGQPVIIPGDMGRSSFLLAGTEESMKLSFGSTCHGAGRLLSRKQAKKEIRGSTLKEELEAKGIVVEAGSLSGLAEEAPFAYKDAGQVVDICDRAKISKKVAKMRPLGVLKG